MNQDLNEVRERIKDIRIAMMTTRTTDGLLRSRPMVTQDFDDEGHLWFLTSDQTGKTEEILSDPSVNLAFSDIGGHNYVSVCGTAIASKNKEDVKRLWSPAHKAWFPLGKDDPHLVAIRVEVHEVEAWDSSSNKMVQLFGMLKSIAKGEAHRPGEHKHIELH